MAWKEQCELAAVEAIDNRMVKGMTKRDALEAVSKESDIPVGTLIRWKYSKKTGFNNEPEDLNYKAENNPYTEKDAFSATDDTSSVTSTTESKKRRVLSQATIWKRTEKKMANLLEYMRVNCETSADMDDDVRQQVYGHIHDLDQYKQELQNAKLL